MKNKIKFLVAIIVVNAMNTMCLANPVAIDLTRRGLEKPQTFYEKMGFNTTQFYAILGIFAVILFWVVVVIIKNRKKK